MPLGTLRRIFEAAGASLVVDVRWRGGELEHLRDARHAQLSAAFARMAEGLGWTAIPEYTYSEFGERGSIDLLCINRPLLAIAVIEIKSELLSLEATLRKHDEKVRLAPALVQRQLGWRPRAVARVLVLPDTSTARRRVAAARSLLDIALPARAVELRAWMKRPLGVVGGIWFLPDTTVSRASKLSTSARRVRRPRGGSG